jgi:hypothetical protein
LNPNLEKGYIIEFAVDGKHYQKYKEGNIGKMYDVFTQDIEITKMKHYNPKAKIRFKNKETGKIIAIK